MTSNPTWGSLPEWQQVLKKLSFQTDVICAF